MSKIYAQFYRYDLDGILSSAMGDRAIVQLDGRWARHRLRMVAADECKRRGYDAYQILRGPSLLRAVPVFGPPTSVSYLSELATLSNKLHAGGGHVK